MKGLDRVFICLIITLEILLLRQNLPFWLSINFFYLSILIIHVIKNIWSDKTKYLSIDKLIQILEIIMLELFNLIWYFRLFTTLQLQYDRLERSFYLIHEAFQTQNHQCKPYDLSKQIYHFCHAFIQIKNYLCTVHIQFKEFHFSSSHFQMFQQICFFCLEMKEYHHHSFIHFKNDLKKLCHFSMWKFLSHVFFLLRTVLYTQIHLDMFILPILQDD